jgi:hypothetical protein
LNANRNVWYKAAQEYGRHRCLPAHNLPVGLCHYCRDGLGTSEVTERNKTRREHRSVLLNSWNECLGASKLLYWGQFSIFWTIYFRWYNNQPQLVESQSECGLSTTQVLKYSAKVFISWRFNSFVGLVYATI